MARYIDEAILELKNQLILAPKKVRLKQLKRAESLLDILKPGKMYPYEFLCHRITGYRPVEHAGKIFRGEGLIKDLVTLIGDVSASLNMTVEDMEEIDSWKI